MKKKKLKRCNKRTYTWPTVTSSRGVDRAVIMCIHQYRCILVTRMHRRDSARKQQNDEMFSINKWGRNHSMLRLVILVIKKQQLILNKITQTRKTQREWYNKPETYNTMDLSQTREPKKKKTEQGQLQYLARTNFTTCISKNNTA